MADTVYDRIHGVGERDPLADVPLYGGPAHAVVQQARPAQDNPQADTGV
ncbi:hypothetical protein ACH41H_44070 [Streptomyces sp. NPDC020800]